MNDSHDKHIAAQALKALVLRRQFERGELTRQEYFDQLNALQPAPPVADPSVRPPTAEPPSETNSGQDGKVSEPQPKLVGALAVLQLRKRLDDGDLTPQEYLAELDTKPETTPEPTQNKPLPPQNAVDTPLIPKMPAVVTLQPIPERFMVMKCPRCGADLSIYNQTTDIECGSCGAEIAVERKGCIIELRPAAELEKPVTAAAATIQTDEILRKLMAELGMATRVKRLAGILGGLSFILFSYIGVADIVGQQVVRGAGILLGTSALLVTVVCITKHTNRVRANLNARIRAITPEENL